VQFCHSQMNKKYCTVQELTASMEGNFLHLIAFTNMRTVSLKNNHGAWNWSSKCENVNSPSLLAHNHLLSQALYHFLCQEYPFNSLIVTRTLRQSFHTLNPQPELWHNPFNFLIVTRTLRQPFNTLNPKPELWHNPFNFLKVTRTLPKSFNSMIVTRILRQSFNILNPKP